MSGDVIRIATKPSIINISGEVNNPMSAVIRGKRLKYYIKASGGLAPDADQSNIWVVYPNGLSKNLTLGTFSPVILDGSIINIGDLPKKSRFY